MKNIKNISIIILGIIILFLGYSLFTKKSPTFIKTKVKIEIPVPAKYGVFDPVVMPLPKKEKRRPKLEEEFINSDSIIKDSLYSDAITERYYEEFFEDSVQSITVMTNVQGKLLNQAVVYETNPYTIPIDTILEIPIPKKNKIFVGGEIIIPIGQEDYKPSLKGNLMWKTKDDNIFSVGYDTRGNGYFGYNIKL